MLSLPLEMPPLLLGIKVQLSEYILFPELLHQDWELPLQTSCRRRFMGKGELFRLTRWAMAIAQRDSRNTAIVVPEGAIIEVLNGPFDGVRLMDVRYNGELVMMFTNDMETHTKKLKAETPKGIKAATA
jgi:hypothetical protein